MAVGPTRVASCVAPGPALGQAEHINWKEAPAMGNMHLAASSSSGGGNYTFLILIVVLFGLFYFVMIRPQRARQRKLQEQQREAVPGQRVRTTSGMYGTLVSTDGDDVVLEIAPGVEVKMLRRAILEVIPDGAEDANFGNDGTTYGNDAPEYDGHDTGSEDERTKD
ncbi:MAG TPA: preprotein translocase subunit YajC [Streptosporangiaceae bacterium]|jgi:preprotein translocase subunit YajC|nr:preprotein translocase subunit YajC [Streptosporangiaceae bacterium]